MGIEVPQDKREDIPIHWSSPANVAQNTMSSRDCQVRVKVEVRDDQCSQRGLGKKLNSTTVYQWPDKHRPKVILEQELAANRDRDTSSGSVDRVDNVVDMCWHLVLELMMVMLGTMSLLHDEDVRLVSDLLDNLPTPPNDSSCGMVAAKEGHSIPGD